MTPSPLKCKLKTQNHQEIPICDVENSHVNPAKSSSKKPQTVFTNGTILELFLAVALLSSCSFHQENIINLPRWEILELQEYCLGPENDFVPANNAGVEDYYPFDSKEHWLNCAAAYRDALL